MQLFHGSTKEITHPQHGQGNLRNDYGRGFYCTENIELAREWACGGGTDGIVNSYTLDADALSVCRLNGDGYSILNWLAVLARYRTYWQSASIAETAKQYLQEHFFVDVESYDLIIGYRADDSYFSFAQDFVSNAISLRKLSEAMHLGKLGEQVVLKSSQAFSAIRFMGSETVEADVYYEKKQRRDLEAQRAYRALRTDRDTIEDIFMLDIMREEMTHGDPRLS